MKVISLYAVILVGSLVMEALGQQAKPIPIYPGAKLVTEKQEGVEPECCDFLTTDAFEKVLSFYEKQLKTKPMDTKALAAAYPALKQQLQMLEQQMPPTAKLRGFVLEEVTVNGQKSPVLFEVMGSAEGVRFSVGDNALAGNDAQFAKEWREKTGKLTSEETAQKEADLRNADEDKEQKERDARHAKEEPEYRAKMTAELLTFLKQNKVDLSPGLQCEHIQWNEGETSSVYAFYFTSQDDFKKVYDFYASRGKAVPIDNAKGGMAGWSKYETVCFWRQAEFLNGTPLWIEVREVSLTNDGPKKTYVAVSVTSSNTVKKLREIDQEYRSRW
jgi:hypothetical protein